MRTVITYGTFDTFHYGHLLLLQRARALGDRLVVALSTDEFNENEKHKKTMIPYAERKRMLEELRCVDRVIPETSWGQKVRDIQFFDAGVFVIGDDWTGKFDDLKGFCEVVYLPRTPEISSTLIKKNIKNV